MRRRDLGFAVLIVLLWGANFVAIDKGLARLPPLLFVALRFLLTAFPAVFVVPRPQVGCRIVLALGLLMCVGQFGFLFVAISDGMPAGLASVVVQSQALFTVLVAAGVLHERPNRRQVLGLGIAVCGLGVVAVERGGQVPLHAFALVIAAAACWGGANVLSRAAHSPHPVSLLVHSALVAPVPLAVMSIVLEGSARDLHALNTFDLTDAAALTFNVAVATMLGFGGWYWLLDRYPAGTIAPLALMVPASGMTSAWILLGEKPVPAQIAGAAIAVCGVAVVVFGASSRPKPVAGSDRWPPRPRSAPHGPADPERSTGQPSEGINPQA